MREWSEQLRIDNELEYILFTCTVVSEGGLYR
jgi:hypothetical protein